MTLIVLFGDVEGGRTRVTIHEVGVPSAMHEPARLGWDQSLDKVEETLRHRGAVRPVKQKITPSLMFVGSQHGKAEEAIHFYTSLFRDSRIVALERYGPGEGDTEGAIKFAAFTLGGQTFNAMDSGLPHSFTFTPAVSLFVDCGTEDELDELHVKLSEGGSVLMPLDRYPFAEKYSWVNDRFGVSWQLILRK